MTEDIFAEMFKCAPHGWRMVADGIETLDEHGNDAWAISERRIENEVGEVIAKLTSEPPKIVSAGCPYRSGLI